MLVLSAGIAPAIAVARSRDLSRPAEAPGAPPGKIIPEWWATSFRNDGRNYLGRGWGDIIPESWAACPGISRFGHSREVIPVHALGSNVIGSFDIQSGPLQCGVSRAL